MSFSYSGLTNYGKNGAPSDIAGWYNANNIVQDPPSSIQTRRIDKVQETSAFTDLMDMQTDRLADSIRVFARGVNPCVGVSYQNNGGQQASLPYKVAVNGAFRPPILRQEDLLPLSRMNRNATSMSTYIVAPDFSKRIYSCNPSAENLAEVRNTISHGESLGTQFQRRDDTQNAMDGGAAIRDIILPARAVSANTFLHDTGFNSVVNVDPFINSRPVASAYTQASDARTNIRVEAPSSMENYTIRGLQGNINTNAQGIGTGGDIGDHYQKANSINRPYTEMYAPVSSCGRDSGQQRSVSKINRAMSSREFYGGVQADARMPMMGRMEGNVTGVKSGSGVMGQSRGLIANKGGINRRQLV